MINNGLNAKYRLYLRTNHQPLMLLLKRLTFECTTVKIPKEFFLTIFGLVMNLTCYFDHKSNQCIFDPNCT